VRHAGAGGESTTFNTRDFDIQVSNNGTAFSTVVQARGNTVSVTDHTVNTSGRFIRLVVINGEQAGGTARIYEFEAYGTTNPPPTQNLALNKPATGTTPCNANEGPEKAVNGSVSGGNSDKFCSEITGNKLLTVDLGASMALRTFTVRHAAAGGEGADMNTRDFDLQVSANGTTFNTVVQARGNTLSVSTHTVTASARFVRLVVITPEQSGGNAARIYELEVYA
jgi:hypothetical protein